MSYVRFLTAPNAVLWHFSGRSYKANGLGVVDVLTSDAPGIHGQGTRLFEMGTTAQRPVPVAGAMPRSLGYAYYDQSLAGMIFWTGSGWINGGGTAV
jgi:hypothetical protein